MYFLNHVQPCVGVVFTVLATSYFPEFIDAAIILLHFLKLELFPKNIKISSLINIYCNYKKIE